MWWSLKYVPALHTALNIKAVRLIVSIYVQDQILVYHHVTSYNVSNSYRTFKMCQFLSRSVPFELESESEIVQSCPTLFDPMDCSQSGSSVHGVVQARVLEWVAISFSKGSSRPRDRSWVSHIVGRCFTVRATREAELEDVLKCLPGSKAESWFHDTELRFQYHVLVGWYNLDITRLTKCLHMQFLQFKT